MGLNMHTTELDSADFASTSRVLDCKSKSSLEQELPIQVQVQQVNESRPSSF
jgi:hypothetical protein